MKQYRGSALIFLAILWQACSPAHSVQQGGSGPQSARPQTVKRSSPVDVFLQLPGLQSAQAGIVLYDPAKAEYKVDYQGDKYFIPASNTKLFSLYAGMRYLGDSLVGMRYTSTDTALFIVPSGDPTLLHPDFPDQPVICLLQKAKQNIYLSDNNWRDKPLGRGWAWDDYNDDYMAERSAFPVYGNVISWVEDSTSASFYSIPDINWSVRFSPDSAKQFSVRRDFHNNAFEITEGKGKAKQQDVPFITDGVHSAAVLLKDTIGRSVGVHNIPARWMSHLPQDTTLRSNRLFPGLQVLHSRPVDSLFRPMMCNSDNFFAEQTLLMVSNELLGKMNDGSIIDTLLKNDLKDLPQRPTWVDGCGLSRNDLFTPRDFVWLLDKLQKEFGLTRMKNILPTGGKGTLASYYKQDSGYIYAKTGSLSGVVALSGYLITKKDHLLLFSVLVNNYNGSGVAIRRQIEQLIHQFRDTY